MEEVYATLLLHSVGKEITEENLKKVLESAGAKIDEAKIKALVASLEGVSLDEIIKEASFVPATPQPKEEKKEEEKKEEKKAEEAAAAGLSALFG